MWKPWQALTGWGQARQAYAVENARAAAVACSRARLERAEVDLYLAQLAEARQGLRRDRPPITA